MSFLSRSAICILVGLGAAVAFAQNPAESGAASYSPGDVVAVIEGVEYTAEQIEWLRQNTPPEFAKQTAAMTYGGFMEALAMQIAVAKRAEELKLAEKEPYRTRLEINQRIFLTHAYLSEIQQVLKLDQDDYRQYYEQHQSDYEELKVSAIYIQYALNPEKAATQDGEGPLSEKDAWAKAERLLLEIRQGADFAAMAREHSDDPASAEKGGDLGYFKRDSRIPEPLKDAIFALQEGEFSAPVRYGGRYYILQVTERRTMSYTDALPNILQKIQDVKIKEQLDQIKAEMQLEIKVPAFAASMPAGPASGAPAAPPAQPQP